MRLNVKPGRWLVEVNATNDGYRLSHIDESGRAHGGPGPSLLIPGVHEWFDELDRLSREETAAMLAEDD